MTRHSLYPSFVRISYTGVTHVHHQVLQVSPSTTPVPGSAPTLNTRDNTDTGFLSALNTYLDLLAVIYPSSWSVVSAEFYHTFIEGDTPTFIYGYNPGQTGTHGDPRVKWQRFTLSMLTTLSNPFRLVLLETVHAANLTYRYADLPTEVKDIVDYMQSGSCWMLGRDDAYPLQFLSGRTKTDDALRKKG